MSNKKNPASVSLSVMSDSLQPQGLQPTRLLCPWDSSGKNTGVGSCSLLQGNLPNPGIKPRSRTLQMLQTLVSEPPGKPKTMIQLKLSIALSLRNLHWKVQWK